MNFTTDVVIGLEIHVELATNSKLFCGCKRAGDKDELPNTRVCPICLGHPGSKPVLNKKVVDYALKLALATDSDIAKELVFSRKSYFYPDMAKNYQISQFELPLASNGSIELSDGTKINLTRIHVEEDPASLTHPSGMGSSSHVLVDYNRSGDPLCEVVTEPEMETPAQARDFMKQLITILRYLKIFDINDCIIKADANISIKESGYIRSEVKNITGFKDIERAIEYEIQRQRQAVEDGKQLVQETRGWDSDKGITRSMRVKETEEDYGYIIDPDLVITDITDEWVHEVKESLPELPREKAKRYIKELRIPEIDANVIANTYELAQMFESVLECVKDKAFAAKWIRRELTRVMNYNKIDFDELKITGDHLKDLVCLMEEKKITDNVAQKIIEKLQSKPFDVKDHVKSEGLEAVADSGELEKICKEALDEAPNAVADFKSGNEKALNFVVGIVMKKTKGAASPQEVMPLLKKLASE